MKNGDKVKISILVDRDTLENFKNYVLSKYGCLWKYLGEEVSKALEAYLSSQTQTAACKNDMIPLNDHVSIKTMNKLTSILSALLKYQELHNHMLEDIIKQNAGTDNRTIKKYVKILQENGFIKQYSRRVSFEDKDILLAFGGKMNRDEIDEKYTIDEIEKQLINYFRKIGKPIRYNVIYHVDNNRIQQFLQAPASDNPSNAKAEIAQFARDRYEVGDSLDEIKDKLADFGVDASKKAVRALVRRGGGWE